MEFSGLFCRFYWWVGFFKVSFLLLEWKLFIDQIFGFVGGLLWIAIELLVAGAVATCSFLLVVNAWVKVFFPYKNEGMKAAFITKVGGEGLNILLLVWLSIVKGLLTLLLNPYMIYYLKLPFYYELYWVGVVDPLYFLIPSAPLEALS